MTAKPIYIADRWPAALRLNQAAEYCGLSVETFKAVCPIKPLMLDVGYDLYLSARIDEWRDRLPGLLLMTPAKGHGLVYVAGFGPYVKIGFTKGIIDERIAALQTGCPEKIEVYAVLDGSPSYEARLHRRFASCGTQGEWFRREGDLAHWIDGGCR
jgi:hypothetical protein